MASVDPLPPADRIRVKDVIGVFALSEDEVEFRTGLTSGTAFVISDARRRGLLASIARRIVLPDSDSARPWNRAERELLQELLPDLETNGIVELEGRDGPSPGDRPISNPGQLLRKPLTSARVIVVGHGILGEAVRGHLADLGCASIGVIKSSSVSQAIAEGIEPSLPTPLSAEDWARALTCADWIVAAQDAFEPEELVAVNAAALQLGIPWSLICCDGYEGWVGPTFVPRQTACFSCFQRRLLAGIAEPKHVFKDPGVSVYRVPSPCRVGPETRPWTSLIASLFALEILAVMSGRGFTLNAMLVVHRLNLTFQRESVLRLPRCPECSPRGAAARQNVFSHILSARHGSRV
jgi:bacteriocin biosynthesis cyclodehydratase domain-containing protein